MVGYGNHVLHIVDLVLEYLHNDSSSYICRLKYLSYCHYMLVMVGYDNHDLHTPDLVVVLADSDKFHKFSYRHNKFSWHYSMDMFHTHYNLELVSEKVLVVHMDKYLILYSMQMIIHYFIHKSRYHPVHMGYCSYSYVLLYQNDMRHMKINTIHVRKVYLGDYISELD